MNTSLYHEIKQTKPFQSLEQEVYISIRLTAQVVDQPWVRHLRSAVGISPSQYNLLRILRGAGTEGRTMSEIGERMINRDPDVTRLADRLVKRGLARRIRHPKDRRVIKLLITPAGLDMLKKLDVDAHDFLTQRLGAMGEIRLRQLRDLLGEVRANLRPYPPQPAAS